MSNKVTGFVKAGSMSRMLSNTGRFLGAVGFGMVLGAQAYAADQIVDAGAAAANQAQLTETLNHTPVENIAAPNSAGLSHNKFSQFNVGTQGLVINNSSVNVSSKIGGALVANPNLAGGEARIILNEVTGSSRSQLNGTQELVGGRADYILANPNGITCDGCGFINFPRATLTTGKPVLGAGGDLTGFNVTGGDIAIESLGLNASQADAFDVITRAMTINGQINANTLRLTAGCNSVDYASGAATAQACSAGSAPAFAVDSTALGGMYAGRIALVGTEAGVGVRMLGAMAASVDDISLDVNGKITLSDHVDGSGNTVPLEVSAAGNITLKSRQAAATAGDELVLADTKLYAGGNTTLDAGDIALDGGRTGARGDLTIIARNYTDTGTGLRDAGHDLTLTASGTLTADAITLQAGHNAKFTADSATVQNGAQFIGSTADGTGDLNVAVTNGLTLTNGALGSGNTASISADTVSLDAASNAGGAKGIHSTGAATVTATTSIDSAGFIGGDGGLTITAPSLTLESGSTTLSGSATSVNTTTLDNSGYLGGDGSLTVKADTLTNRNGGILSSAGAVSLSPNASAGSSLTTENGSTIKGDTLTATYASVSNAGTLYGATSATVTTGSLTNTSTGLIASPGTLTLTQSGAGGSLTNSGNVEAGTLALTFDTVANNAGEIYAASSGTLTSLDLTNASKILSDGGLTLDGPSGSISTFNNTASGVVNAATLYLGSSTVTNDNTIYSSTWTHAVLGTLTNHGAVQSGGDIDLSVYTLNNIPSATYAADIVAYNNLNIHANNILKNQVANGLRPRLVAQNGTLTIDASGTNRTTQNAENDGGLLFAGNGLNIYVARQFINQASGVYGGYTFANAGTMNIGAKTSADLLASSQDVTVSNIDSQIENKGGDINIIASYFYNKPSAYTPIKSATITGYTSGSIDYTGNGDTVNVYSNCGSFYDAIFDEYGLGHLCASSYTVTTETLTNPDAGLHSKLVASGDINLFIEKQALNYISLMSAGGSINLDGATGSTFTNQAVTLKTSTTAAVIRYDDGGTTFNPVGDCYDSSGNFVKCFYAYAGDNHAPSDLTDHKKKFTSITSTIPDTYAIAVDSTVEAVTAINVTGGISIVNANDSGTQTTGSQSTAISAPATTGPTAPGTGSTTIGTQDLSSPVMSAISALSDSPFFVHINNPTSPYLYETDPSLISLAGLYSSDLFLTSLGLDPESYRRVGDAYYEQQLLREQLLAEAGQRFIEDGMANENDQYKYLLNNGVRAKKDLQLTVGVALTADQVNSLQKDIVWMVEKVVDGQKVLVPQLYMCSATRAKLAHGAKFVSKDININTEGPVTNSGAFVASNDIKVKTGSTFTNHLGTITAGNDLDITAHNDIVNESGHIKGNNVSLTSETGSVVNKTLTHDVQVTGSLGTGTDTQVGDTATIEAGNNLNVHAHDDVVSEGGSLKAGNDASLTADTGDVTLKGIQKKSYHDSVSVTTGNGETKTKTSREQETTNVGSSLQVGGNLTTSAGQDININGSSVDVKGNAKLHAGGDINITAAAETSHTETSSSTGAALHHSSDKTTVDQTTGAASSLGIGGNLTIDSGGDTNIVGSDVGVDGDLNVKNIGGDLNVTTFKSTTTVHNEHKESSVFGGGSTSAKREGDTASSYTAKATGTLYQNSSETTDINSTTNRGSSIVVGGNLNAGNDAIKGDANITGSSIATGGDLNLSAKGDVNVMAAHDTTSMHQTSHSDQFNVSASASVDGAKAGFGEQHNDNDGTANQSTAQVSSLSSGGNMNIHAGGDFTEEGAQVDAGGDINLDASSVNSLAAQDTYSETGDSLSVETTLGVHADTGLGGVVDSFVDKNGKAKLDMAGAASSINGLSAPDAGSVGAELSVSVTHTKSGKNGHTATASSFTSGGNVNITARDGDATFQGTNVDAGGSIDVTAKKGSVNVLTADSGEGSHSDTTTATVTVGVSGDGSISGDGSGGTSHEDSTSTSQAAATFKAGKGISVNAQKDVTLVGTNIDAKNDVTVSATEGKIDFKAARDTTESNSNSNNTSAGVTVDPSGGGGVRGGHDESRSHSDSSTGHAGSISGANITLKSKGDISLEGTNLDGKGDVNLQTQGKLDYSAVKDTSNSTTKGGGGHFDVSASKTGGGVSGGGSSTDEEEHSVTRTGGSINAGHLNISTGDGGARLEGTKVKADSASIDTGTGKLTIESAVSTHTKKVNDTSADVGIQADVKEHSGSASVTVDDKHEDTNQVTNSNASLDIGGKLDIKSGGGIDVKGKDVKDLGSVAKAGSTDTHGAKVTVEQRHDVNKSKKSSTHVSVGVIVPSKKVRHKAKEQVSHSKLGHHAKQKLATAKSHVSNAASKVHTKAKNAVSSVKTRVKNHGADATTRAANKKAHQETKHANNAKLAETVRTNKDKARDTKRTNASTRANRKANKAQAKVTAKQNRKDQKADYDRQKADSQAQKEHDKKLADLGPNATQADKDHLASELTSRKKANANGAAQTKTQNSTAAAAARKAGHDKLAQRKHEIEDKAAASKTRHTNEAANKKLALADKLTDSHAKEVHKKQVTAEQKQRNNAIEATKSRDKAQHTLEQDASHASTEKRHDDRVVENDHTLDASAKAGALKHNAEVHADAAAAAKKKHADEEGRISKQQDRVDRRHDEKAVDQSNLTDTEKQARKAEIATKYADRTQHRKDLRRNRKQQADAEADHAKTVAGAEHQHSQDVIQADKNLETAKTQADSAKTAADQRADRRKAQQEATLAARTGLTRQQRERRQKRIDERHEARLNRNAADHDQSVKDATSNHEKDKKKAQQDRDNKVASTDASLEHTQGKLNAEADKLHAYAASNDAKHQAIQDSSNAKRGAAANARDKKIADAADQHDQAVQQAKQEFDAHKEKVGKGTRISEAEAAQRKADGQQALDDAKDTRKQADTDAETAYDKRRQEIKDDSSLSAEQKTEEHDKNRAQRRAAKKLNAENEQHALNEAQRKLEAQNHDIDKATRLTDAEASQQISAKQQALNDAKAASTAAHTQSVQEANQEHRTVIATADAKVSQVTDARNQADADAGAAYDKRRQEIRDDSSLSPAQKAEAHAKNREQQRAATKANDKKERRDLKKARADQKKAKKKADAVLEAKKAAADRQKANTDRHAETEFQTHKRKIEKKTQLTEAEASAKVAAERSQLDPSDQRAQRKFEARKKEIERNSTMTAQERKQSLDDAKSARDNAVTAAGTAKQQAEQDAKDEHRNKEADRANEHAQQVAHANAKVSTDKALANKKHDQQVALADALHKKKTEDARVETDSSLSDTDKANSLKQNADTHADEQAQARKKIADAERDAANVHDDRERTREKDLVDQDSSLSSTQKQEKKDAIDAKYDRRKELNDAEHAARVSEADVAKVHAETTANAEHDQRKALVKAKDDKKSRDTDAANEKQNAESSLDPNAADYAKKKQEIEDAYQRKLEHSEAQHGLDVRKADAETQKKREQADAQKRKSDALAQAELDKKRALAEVDGNDTLTAAQKTKRREKIGRQYDDATTKADERHNAANDASEARNELAQAQITREHADADVDADGSLSAKDKAARKKENAKTAAGAEKAARKKLASSEQKLQKFMTPEEKAAAKASAQTAKAGDGKSAEGGDGKVKNPYSRAAKFKRHVVAPTKRFAVKAARWKEILTSIGVTVTHPLEETPPAEADTPDLLALMNDVKNLPPAQQAGAMRMLRDPAVRAASAISTAMDSRHQALQEQEAAQLAQTVGVDLGHGGVLTTKAKREILAQHGVNISQGATMAEVRSQYDALVNKLTVAPPLSVQEKEQMLEALGYKKETEADKINKAFSQVLSKGETQFKSLTKGLSADQVNALHQGLLQTQP